jgi:formyltetrahydrofolate deformylase
MYILRLSCKDEPGIVAAVATCLSNNQCNIEDSSQFHDKHSGRFFMRVVFDPLEDGCLDGFKNRFKEIADSYSMEWHVTAISEPVQTLVMVSKTDHCLNDLLYRWRTKQLNIDITGVVSNHEDNRILVEERGLPFHYLPITKKNKTGQEAEIRKIIGETNTELVILARYMQILSADMCNDYAGRVINIHHSFLPGFKGAKPYHQAYERGVKLIGATAHFATQDLDEGPIIEQEIKRVDHSHDPRQMQSMGRDIESRVLARAIQLYTERRIFMHGKRTIIL